MIQSQSGFRQLGLHPALCERLSQIGFEKPTDIQERFIPLALASRDLIGEAKTGTGKTAAFLLPIFQRLVLEGKGTGLVVAPTREIAIQTHAEARRFARNLGEVPMALIYGGDPIAPQMRRLDMGVRLIVGTPGRLLDVGRRGALKFGKLDIVVLDEADRMFDLGFREDLHTILKQCTARTSTWMLSATMPEGIIRLARRFLRRPESLLISEDVLTVDEVQQVYYSVAANRKRSLLMEILRRESPSRAIVFCRTKRKADRLADILRDRGLEAAKIHGDMPQDRRTRVFQRMKAGKIGLLIATNVAARGLDIQNVSHIINFDMPDDAEDYIHRIGRTARMGASGRAISFVTPEDGGMLTLIERLINQLIEREELDGFDNGLEPVDAAVPDAVSTVIEHGDSFRAPDSFGQGLL